MEEGFRVFQLSVNRFLKYSLILIVAVSRTRTGCEIEYYIVFSGPHQKDHMARRVTFNKTNASDVDLSMDQFIEIGSSCALPQIADALEFDGLNNFEIELKQLNDEEMNSLIVQTWIRGFDCDALKAVYDATNCRQLSNFLAKIVFLGHLVRVE